MAAQLLERAAPAMRSACQTNLSRRCPISKSVTLRVDDPDDQNDDDDGELR